MNGEKSIFVFFIFHIYTNRDTNKPSCLFWLLQCWHLKWIEMKWSEVKDKKKYFWFIIARWYNCCCYFCYRLSVCYVSPLYALNRKTNAALMLMHNFNHFCCSIDIEVHLKCLVFESLPIDSSYCFNDSAEMQKWE